MSQLHYLELRFKPNQYLNEIYSGIEEVDQQQFVIGFTEDSKLRNILLSLRLKALKREWMSEFGNECQGCRVFIW